MTDIDFSSTDFDKLLDDFISSQLNEVEDYVADKHALSESSQPTEQPKKSPEKKLSEEEKNKELIYNEYISDFSDKKASLELEEFRLFEAILNLMKSSINCAQNANIKIKKFTFNIDDIIPRFNPNKIQNISETILYAWDLLIKSYPKEIEKIPQNASDEQILNYAENCSDKNLTMALISYVESLIEIDACEIAYNLRKVKYKKYKIEKRIYEEEMARKEKTRLYINAIKQQNFPINAEQLVTNFFKTLKKDPDAAKKIIEKNPATFSPIQTEKIPNKFFGFIKAGPEDCIKINKKIGKFIKNLKI